MILSFYQVKTLSCVFSVPLDLRAEHFLSFCLQRSKMYKNKVLSDVVFWKKTFGKCTPKCCALPKYILASHFTGEHFSDALQKCIFAYKYIFAKKNVLKMHLVFFYKIRKDVVKKQSKIKCTQKYIFARHQICKASNPVFGIKTKFVKFLIVSQHFAYTFFTKCKQNLQNFTSM